MNTTLNILRSPTASLETRRTIFDQLKRSYYNDDITYEQLEAYTEVIYGTTHREFGDLPAIQPIKVPSVLEDLGVEANVGDVAELYARLFNFYKRGIIGDRELPSLFPITTAAATRIKFHETALAHDVAFAAVAEAF
jgi:hypothetical protein